MPSVNVHDLIGLPLSPSLLPVHGGPDALGPVRCDFSTNANAAGPCPLVVGRLQAVDASHYPDPSYAALRAALATHVGVRPEQIVMAASGSEAITRMTAAMHLLHGAGAQVHVPREAYGDYARAAAVWGLQRTAVPAQAHLLWQCEPASPGGQLAEELSGLLGRLIPAQTLVLDLAYAPLRLDGEDPWLAAAGSAGAEGGVAEVGVAGTCKAEGHGGATTWGTTTAPPAGQGAWLRPTPARAAPEPMRNGAAAGPGGRLATPLVAGQTPRPTSMAVQQAMRSMQADQLARDRLPPHVAVAPAAAQGPQPSEGKQAIPTGREGRADLDDAGRARLAARHARRIWRLVTPNKALGLTGIRAAFLIAPDAALDSGTFAARLLQQLLRMAPSWPVGSHGVCMLQAWCDPAVQAWVLESKAVLRAWRARQVDRLRRMGWQLRPSVAPFVLAQPPGHPGQIPAMLDFFRQRGVKLRDAASLGAPGWVRMGVRSPADQVELEAAWQAWALRNRGGSPAAGETWPA